MNESFAVRIVGDPVLREVAQDVEDIDASLVSTTESMLDTMYAEPGIGLAAPQVGIKRRFFVYDVGDGPETLVNPRIVESEGSWTYQEGCLSVPGLFWDLVRPKKVHMVGYDLDGNEVSIEADELLARLFQHEMDHLNGVLLLDHLEEDQRKEAMKTLRERQIDKHTKEILGTDSFDEDGPGGLSLP